MGEMLRLRCSALKGEMAVVSCAPLRKTRGRTAAEGTHMAEHRAPLPVPAGRPSAVSTAALKWRGEFMSRKNR